MAKAYKFSMAKTIFPDIKLSKTKGTKLKCIHSPIKVQINVKCTAGMKLHEDWPVGTDVNLIWQNESNVFVQNFCYGRKI